MAELGSSIMKMAPQMMQMAGSAATAMGQPEIGIPLSMGSNLIPGQTPTSGQLATPQVAGQLAAGSGATPNMVQGYGPGRSMGQMASDVGNSLSAVGSSPIMQGLGGIAGIANQAMSAGGQQQRGGQQQQQPPPQRPPGGGGGMPAPMQQMGMGSGPMQPPQAAGASAGVGMAQNPQYAAMIRQMLMGQGGGMG